MNFKDTTIAIGLTSTSGETRIVELSNPRQLHGRTLDQIIFVLDLDDIPITVAKEWQEASFYATFHSKSEHRITRLL